MKKKSIDKLPAGWITLQEAGVILNLEKRALWARLFRNPGTRVKEKMQCAYKGHKCILVKRAEIEAIVSPEYISTEEAGKILKCTPCTALKFLKRHNAQWVKRRNGQYFKRSEVEKLQKERFFWKN